MLLCILYAPQTSSSACYMRPHSGPFLSFLAYYMRASSEQFLRIDYGGPLRSVYSLIIWRPRSLCIYSYYIGAPRIISLHSILMAPPDHFLRLLYGAPQVSFSTHTIWGPLLDHFHCLLYAPPLRSVSLHAIGGPPQIIFFFTKYMGPSSDQFLRLLYEAPSG